MKMEKSIQIRAVICLLLSGFLFLFENSLVAQEKIDLISGEKLSIQSKILNQERVISVCLPDNYKGGTQKFPVLYLLDGTTHFHHATGAVSFLNRQGIIPQMIIVSIHNIDRNKDFSPVYNERFPTSGGAEKFLAFIAEELMPYINKKYRASDFAVLEGHSFGGTFATYTLLTKPEVFDAFIAISPFLQFTDNYLVNESKKLLKSSYGEQKYFYMTVGNEPDYFEPLGEFSAQVKEKTGNAIKFDYVKMEAETHGSIPYISLFNGLRFIFSDWQLPQDKFEKGLAEIDKHYKIISQKYGYEIITPEFVINNLGYNYLQQNNIDNAIKIFKENVKRYPKSANVYDSLGEAYENNNQLDLAEKNYQKAYEQGKSNNDPNTLVYQKNFERVKKK